MKSKKAFTLIELLVVIAIIGLLATISVIALNNARAKARDAKRVADVKQIQTALELYFNDMNRYPLTSEFTNQLSSTSTNGTSTYMQIIPSAPTPADGTCSNSDNSYYYSSANGNSYTLSFCVGGQTGSLTGGINNASPVGIAYGGSGSGGNNICSCTDSGVPCCDQCDTHTAVCQGGTYCARTANCPIGQSCVSGTCSAYVYALRDTGPAGGIIFYENPNYATDGWRYLEAAPTDQSGPIAWGCYGTNIPGAQGTALGTGRQNTVDILAGCADSIMAARRTLGDLYSNGYTDWFLPSKDELDKMYINLQSGVDENAINYTPVGGFSGNGYWTSSEGQAWLAWLQYFSDGSPAWINDSKLQNPSYVRAVRAF
jgi:prepilin-type N-terminal cleavage/methylation domain-containing protein